MTLLEQAAKAAYDYHIQVVYKGVGPTWEELPEGIRSIKIEYMRAALTALLEPSPEMEEAGYGAICEHDDSNNTFVTPRVVKPAWQAMLKKVIEQ